MTVLSPAALAPPLDAPAAAGREGLADRLTRGWRGPALAAAVAAAGVAPGLLALPPLDRDESRFAQATTQMLESGDFVDIRFQDAPRDKKPVGIHWLQAAAVRAFSTTAARDIRVYRLPSLLGAMLAAAACAWGAGAVLSPGGAALAGVLMGSGLLLSTEGAVAKTDAVLCGAATLALAALGRLYAEARGAGPAPAGTRAALWLGLALAVLVKGPVGPMVVAATLLALVVADRDGRWVRSLGWGWGLAVMLLVAGPWAAAVTVSSDGAFWSHALEGDVAPKLVGGQQGHGAPPGLHALLASVLFFPGSLLLPAAALAGWTRRRETGTRFALAWLVPSWLIFEALPTKLPHYPLPLYGALAWLAALALPEARRSAWLRRLGAGLALAAAGTLVATVVIATRRYAAAPAPPGAVGPALAAAALAVAAAGVGAVFLLRRRPAYAALAAAALALLAHGVAAAAWAPRLDALWVSARAARLVARAGLDPRNGVTPGPVAVTGYAEPSLVFALGSGTELDDPDDAAISVAAGQPALVESRQDAAFRAALARDGAAADPVGAVSGFDDSEGRPVTLTLWRSRT